MQHSFRFICALTAAILDFRSSRVSEDTEQAIMYRFAKAAANFSGKYADFNLILFVNRPGTSPVLVG